MADKMADLTQSTNVIVAADGDLAHVISQCQLVVEKNAKTADHFEWINCDITKRETAIKNGQLGQVGICTKN